MYTWKNYMKKLKASAKREKMKEDKAWNRAILKAKEVTEINTK